MNKSDIKLIVIILVITSVVFLLFKAMDNNGSKEAHVYYDNDLILKIDLDINEVKEYKVKGLNGDVILEVKKGKVRVKEEISPLNLCSNQGFIQSSYEVIVCLPNKIVVKIVEKDKNIDVIVR
ncbi:MAG: NusG domain II-containing protein [Bacilli bacterium]|nr:NusG domain II-containing protein [Bacilli bacterium]